MGLTSFTILKEAFAFAWANRRAIAAVALFPFCAICIQGLAFDISLWFFLLNLLVLLSLVPFKIDMFRLLLLGEKPEGHYAKRLFHRRELKFFLYETGLTLFVCGLLIVAWLIAARAGETWEGLAASLRLGSAVAVALLLFMAYFYGAPAMFLFPGLSLDRELPLKKLLAVAGPFRARIFFTVFLVFCVFFLIAAVLPQQQPGTAGLGENPMAALAFAVVNAALALAANTVVTFAVALVFKHSLMPPAPPRPEE